MKKIAVLFIVLFSMVGLTACGNTNANNSNTSGGDKMTIKMELDKNYDDTDPFVNEKLFCISKDLDALAAEGTLRMDGESVVLEVKNNKTDEVLWSNRWESNIKLEVFSISLENLKKDDEYVVCFTGTKINHAAIGITFDSDMVKEREKPMQDADTGDTSDSTFPDIDDADISDILEMTVGTLGNVYYAAGIAPLQLVH